MNVRLLFLAKKYYQYVYRVSPVYATYLGVHKYDHQLGDFSSQSIKKQIKRFRGFERELRIKNYELKKWSKHDRIDQRLLLADVRLNLLNLVQIKDWQKNPNLYLETPLMGVFLLVSRNAVDFKGKLRAVIARTRLFPKILRQGRDNVKNPPRIFTQIALETLAGAESFLESLAPMLSAQGQIPAGPKRELLEAVALAQKALKTEKKYLDRLLKKSKGKFALGQGLFEKKLQVEHFLALSAQELFEFGKSEFARIEKELKKTARVLSKKKSWSQLVETYKNETPPAEALVKLYADEVQKLTYFLKKKDLLSFPKKEKCEVLETPGFERPTVPYAAYMPPAPFEKEQTGHFWVTPIDQKSSLKDQKEQLREHSLLSFMITTLHESYPGHHLQFARANQVKSFVRKHGGSSLLCEGWALYCEQMMGEVGYYQDPRTRLFSLKDELWRAARVIIDVGLHCFNLSPKKATALLVQKVKLAPIQARAEVKRYTMSGTQPMSYLVGKDLILRLRARAQQEWGRKFSLKKFHDRFLAAGTIPTPLVVEEMFGKND